MLLEYLYCKEVVTMEKAREKDFSKGKDVNSI